MNLIAKTFRIFVFIVAPLIINSCENREVHSNNEDDGSVETFKDMPVVGIETHFNKIIVDGVEYLILERDRNNPHEGFGFMAFRANTLLQKQDSIIAYLQVQLDNQAQILSVLNKSSYDIEKSLNNQKLGALLEPNK